MVSWYYLLMDLKVDVDDGRSIHLVFSALIYIQSRYHVGLVLISDFAFQREPEKTISIPETDSLHR